MMTTEKNYLTIQKQYTPYKWYKPLLVTLAAFGCFMVFSLVISIVSSVIALNQGYDLGKLLSGGYDTLDAYSPLGAFMSLGGVAVGIPALILGNLMVHARPFSSYSSSRGGFRFGIFAKCMVAALIVVALPLVLLAVFFNEGNGMIKFSVFGFILCTILAPLQCVAEEYVFRGHLMQMFGAWIKFPFIPIILQTVFFAMAHPYNVVGVITISVMGLVLGICAYVTNGLEASCALHITNNMVAYYLVGFGMGSTKTEVAVTDVISTVAVCCIYLAFIIFADKKLGWFHKSKKDDVAAVNEKLAARRQTNTQ